MGYGYGPRGLCCDNCGDSGGVRKRPCTFKVRSSGLHYPGGQRPPTGIPYCPPPALCSECLRKLGGSRKVHAGCKEGAEAMQADCDAQQARLDAGDYALTSGYGSWADWVPEGMTGAIFVNGSGHQVRVLVDADEYDPSTKRFLSHFPNHKRFENFNVNDTEEDA